MVLLQIFFERIIYLASSSFKIPGHMGVVLRYKSAVFDFWALRASLVLFSSEDRGTYESADSKSLAVCTIGDGEP